MKEGKNGRERFYDVVRFQKMRLVFFVLITDTPRFWRMLSHKVIGCKFSGDVYKFYTLFQHELWNLNEHKNYWNRALYSEHVKAIDCGLVWFVTKEQQPVKLLHRCLHCVSFFIELGSLPSIKFVWELWEVEVLKSALESWYCYFWIFVSLRFLMEVFMVHSIRIWWFEVQRALFSFILWKVSLVTAQAILMSGCFFHYPAG